MGEGFAIKHAESLACERARVKRNASQCHCAATALLLLLLLLLQCDSSVTASTEPHLKLHWPPTHPPPPTGHRLQSDATLPHGQGIAEGARGVEGGNVCTDFRFRFDGRGSAIGRIA